MAIERGEKKTRSSCQQTIFSMAKDKRETLNRIKKHGTDAIRNAKGKLRSVPHRLRSSQDHSPFSKPRSIRHEKLSKREDWADSNEAERKERFGAGTYSSFSITMQGLVTAERRESACKSTTSAGDGGACLR